MKKLFFGVAILFVCLLAACTKENFLDQTTTTDLYEQAVFADSSRSMDFLTNIYSAVGFSFDPARFGTAAGLDASCDEAEGPLSSSITTYLQFATGSVGAYSIATDAWNTPYAQIRAVNQFIAHLPTIPFNDNLRRRTRGEALFLRAWYYSLLLKHYGGIPLVGDTVYTTTQKINTTRSTYEECVNYITAQCDSAAAILPQTFAGLDFGRVTKGCALALKAKVLVYAASPLFNGGAETDDATLKAIVGYPTYDASRWQKAADALKAVMDLNLYSLHQSSNGTPGYGFYELFLLRQNEEYIFEQLKPNNKDLEGLWRPPSRGGSSTTGSFPYQNLVDAFEMSNGKAITDPASGYDAANPYANRDPRLDHTVTHNLSNIYVAFGSISPVYTYDGEPNGDGFGAGTPTGYYSNKMCSDNVVPNYFFSDSPRCLPLIRFADILLMYAEVLNEINGPTTEVYGYVESIRKRAGLNPFELPTGLSQDSMRTVIQHERQVELAFEEARFWDVRRWKIAEQTETQLEKGMRVKRNGDGTYTYSIENVRQHAFRTSLYLWPIPQTETAKSVDLLQNPGY